MKRLFIVAIAALVLTSCVESSMCPSYGFTKRITNHGQKAQSRYAKHRGHI